MGALFSILYFYLAFNFATAEKKCVDIAISSETAQLEVITLKAGECK